MTVRQTWFVHSIVIGLSMISMTTQSGCGTHSYVTPSSCVSSYHNWPRKPLVASGQQEHPPWSFLRGGGGIEIFDNGTHPC